jgi:TRAP-type mannitol/chloroaromatic compound transport system permease large subunit
MLIIVGLLNITIIDTLGFSPIWFGVLYVLTCQIAYLTPPFGYNLFLMRAMSPPEFTIKDIYLSVVPFVLLMVLTIALVMIFPKIALWLPERFAES